MHAHFNDTGIPSCYTSIPNWWYRKYLVFYAITYRVVRETMFVDANGNRPLAPNYLVLITDGRSNNRSLTWLEAMAARLQSITILVVCHFQISYEFS